MEKDLMDLIHELQDIRSIIVDYEEFKMVAEFLISMEAEFIVKPIAITDRIQIRLR